MGKLSRRKGHRFERAVARLFREAGFPGARRGLQYRDGEECADVEGTPFHVECKRGGPAKHPLKALAQAVEDSQKHRWPVAICQRDREQATATMLLGDFLDLVKEWKELRDV